MRGKDKNGSGQRSEPLVFCTMYITVRAMSHAFLGTATSFCRARN